MYPNGSVYGYVLDKPCLSCLAASCWSCEYSNENEDIFDLPSYSMRTGSIKKKRSVPSKVAAKKSKSVAQKNDMAFGPVEAHISLPNQFFGEVNDSFLIRANGDGMRNAGIYDGDLVVFEKNGNPNDGDIAILIADGVLMCRRFFREGVKARIRREDGETPDVITENFAVYGVLRGLIRNLGSQGERIGAPGG